MTKPFEHSRTEFYLTSPSPCPYLSGRKERKVFSFLSGPTAPELNALLTQRGFRRSQNIVYLPACDTCSSCKPVRVVANEFEFSKSWQRIRNRNRDIRRVNAAPQATSEQFSILRAYLDARHSDGGMSDMTVLDYTSMIEQTAVDTLVLEYRQITPDGEDRLLGCSLTDRLPDGLSMVYSFFDPDEEARSLGTYMILDHISYALELGLDHIYLGYWVDGSPKMDYKARFQPLEEWTSNGWQTLKLKKQPLRRR
ncbi:MAG: arginyltransferase [Aquisalinus sp.]|nr:arginyltransferase [Aquisalinus sp.]